MTMRPGLCSVTFRQLTAEQVVEACAAAALEVIEWGGDVHVPPGDTARAAAVARATTDAGLAVCSYGSYFRPGVQDDLEPVLDSAQAVGADRVRIWAGGIGSAEASAEHWAFVIARLQAAVEQASTRSITLALEYHSRTLTDTAATTRRLLDEVPGLSTYWQPNVAASDESAIADYIALADRVSAAHVFSWWPAAERLRLRERDSLWRGFFAAASDSAAPPRDALLEFVPDDDPGILAAEAATLRGWLAGAA
ncbi:sugar phosphate isomerase/epimerase [Microbacterium sp. KUDC0406]|uniref:sugar phosphate isomerase/epimerase family protein n=1 Tax=Microbacterium sp. KUDC0406 TaxID=2909588 RepID=UPI001F3D3048|nr:TIM barrel protein [Microbacterium sp. KUDC0406]UJP10099.1 sugar phosphate isomerase/epimerase [Microbacterium sp. KUDC0406]